MEPNSAYVFQHKYTGLQMFVYQEVSVESAYNALKSLVIDPLSWIYLTEKVAIEK